MIESAEFLVDHLAEVPALVISLRLDRPPLDPPMQGGAAAYYGRCCPACGASSWRHAPAGIGSAWTTFHLEHEAEIAELLGVPDSVTQVCLLAVGYYTGDSFTPGTPPLRRRGHLPQPLEATRRLTDPCRLDPPDRRVDQVIRLRWRGGLRRRGARWRGGRRRGRRRTPVR